MTQCSGILLEGSFTESNTATGLDIRPNLGRSERQQWWILSLAEGEEARADCAHAWIHYWTALWQQEIPVRQPSPMFLVLRQ